MTEAKALQLYAHAEMLPLEASGLVGGNHVVLILGGNRDEFSIRVKVGAGTPLSWLKPGMRCLVTLGIVAVEMVEAPEELPGLPAGLLKGMN